MLATRYGVAAVENMMSGNTGRMVSLQGTSITSVPLQDAINEIRKVPVDSDMVRAARAVGISFGDR
jgi:6-phosphofructokinase 1